MAYDPNQFLRSSEGWLRVGSPAPASGGNGEVAMSGRRVSSSVLSQEARAELDEVARAAMTLRGYTIEVTGFASSDGDERKNKVLSERRAKAVIDYLVQTHNVPLRRFLAKSVVRLAYVSNMNRVASTGVVSFLKMSDAYIRVSVIG